MSAPSAPPSETPPPAAPWSAGMVSLALVAGVLLLTVIWQWPHEVERWRQTQAVSARVAGEKEEAYRLLSASIDRDPKNPSLRLLRADWRMTDNEADAALLDLDAAVADHPADLRLREKRGLVYQKLGRHADAVNDWQEIVDRWKNVDDRVRINQLNNVAYARAVGDIDAERGLKQINEAFKLIESTAKASRANEQDTRGFLLYRLGEFEKALEDLNPATDEAEKLLKEDEQVVPATRNQKVWEEYLKERRRMVAVIRYHRGLVYEKLDRADDAEADFARIRELGFEPNEKLQ